MPAIAALALFVMAFAPVVVAAAPAPTVTAAVAQTPQHPEPVSGAAVEHGHTDEEEQGGGWLAVTAKAINFAILVWLLVHFLSTPVGEYLASRGTQIRKDLLAAAQTREAATRQLADIQVKLSALPAELEALKTRGAEEIAAEQVRIAQAAQAERARLLEQTRREIDMRLRVARRELVEHAANLAVGVAAARIERTITPADQARLVDRFAAHVGEARA
ncbi:MAG TPA: hypothetical protein VFX12_05180 [Vicinamibacterales bacterium]|nr:hypothetical protein [Vicinamibacterales bacterium]